MNTMDRNKAHSTQLELTSLHEAAIRRRYRSGKFAIAIITLAILAFLYLLLWPFKVTELGDIVISTDPVKAGQYQRYTAGVCEEPGHIAHVQRSLVFQGTDEAPISTTDTPERQVECTNIILIPTTIPNADYEVVLHLTYKINPIRDALNPIERHFRSKPFTVTEGRDIPLPTNIQQPEKQPDNKDSKPQDAPNNQYQDKEDATPPGGTDTDPNIQGVAPTGPTPSSSGAPATKPRQDEDDPLVIGNPPGQSEDFIDRILDPFVPPILDPIINPLSDIAQDTIIEPIGDIISPDQQIADPSQALKDSGTPAPSGTLEAQKED